MYILHMVDTVNNVFVQQFCDKICNFFGIMALVLTIGKDWLVAASTALYWVFAELSQQNSFEILELSGFVQ